MTPGAATMSRKREARAFKHMNARDQARATALEAALVAHANNRRQLPGVEDSAVRDVLVRQMIDSLHRVQYPAVIASRDVSARRADPASAMFDPVRAALYQHRQGSLDEACWLVFLFVHFGKHARGGYRYARDVYGRLGQEGRWDWPAVSTDPTAFTRWLAAHHQQIKTGGPGGFGNHRKRETLQPGGTGRTVQSYVEWVDPARGHCALFDAALAASGGDGGDAFARLYASMDTVFRFGRTARFDYLTMLGKLGLVAIAPTSTFLKGATGPLNGARRLYGVGSDVPPATLEAWLIDLDADLRVGPQVIEDAICNWQKRPDSYRRFFG